MGKKKIERVEREENGVVYNIELATDTEEPDRNRFEFEGEKYAWIIRAPKPVPGPPVEPKPDIYENIEEILRTVKDIKEKVEKPET